jgi:cytoskeletal protein RodZ
MSSKSIVVAALAVAATIGWQAVSAQASAPVTREQRKADTAAANKAGQLAAPGQAPAPQSKPSGTPTTKTRAERKAETAAANKSGELAAPGQAPGPQTKATGTPTTKTREQRKAETAEAAKAGQLTAPGQGGAPKQ